MLGHYAGFKSVRGKCDQLRTGPGLDALKFKPLVFPNQDVQVAMEIESKDVAPERGTQTESELY